MPTPHVPLSPYLSASNAEFYVYAFFTILTVILFVIVLVVCHWSVKKYKSKVNGGKVELQDVCPIDGRDLVEEEDIEIIGQFFPAGLDIDYSNLFIRREIGEGNFGKVYQGYLQMNEVQR